MVKTKEFAISFLLLSLGIFSIYVYYYIKEAQTEVYTRVESNKIEHISHMFENIASNIIYENNIQNSQELVELLSEENIRHSNEKYLFLLNSPSIKYTYLLIKDNKGRFRFLLDGSKTDKASFYQKFDVENDNYDKIYETKQAQVIRQDNIENLFITYIYPIVVNGEVIAILSSDITTKIHKEIMDLVKPIETFFILLIIFVFLLTASSAMQLFYYFFTKKKIFTDPLTKLYNRNYFQEIVPTLNLQHYSMAMLDLDKFKSINDSYGHKTGDYVLAESAQVFKKALRESDILIRYGGEEFFLLIYNRKKEVSTESICERIRLAVLNHTFNYDNHDIKVSVSIGVHENPSFEKNIQEAVKVADKMLYRAKNEGRNKVIYYNEKAIDMSPSKSKDIDFVKEALNQDRVICQYQPIYDPIQKEILKYEALVRIVSNTNEIIAPGYFLEALKHTNIHYKLTQRILSIIFEKFQDNDESVSININFSDLLNQDIENTIIESFNNNKGLAHRVTFEILESDEIDNIPLFKQKIDLLHSMGSKISIDDFGSGYSNFRSILDIEANYLKIDGSLIKNIDKNEKDYKVVKSIINFAKEANMETVAEFVHSAQVYDKLQELDINYLQGYYIAKPTNELSSKEDLFK